MSVFDAFHEEKVLALNQRFSWLVKRNNSKTIFHLTIEYINRKFRVKYIGCSTFYDVVHDSEKDSISQLFSHN